MRQAWRLPPELRNSDQAGFPDSDQPTASLMHFFSKLFLAAPESFFSFEAA